MKVVEFTLQGFIELDDDASAKDLKALIKQWVEDGSASVERVLGATISCGCGGKLDELEESCRGCVPERQEWRESDRRG